MHYQVQIEIQRTSGTESDEQSLKDINKGEKGDEEVELLKTQTPVNTNPP